MTAGGSIEAFAVACLLVSTACFPEPPQCGPTIECPPSSDPCVVATCEANQCVDRPTALCDADASDTTDAENGSDSDTGATEDIEIVTPIDTEVAKTDTDAAIESEIREETDVVARECDTNEDCGAQEGPCAQGVCQADGTCLRVPRQGSCDDGDACTRDDACAGTECVGSRFVCDDGLACTNDVCDGAGGCLTRQVATGCLVAGACYAVGDRNPSNPCQVCAQGTSWSPADEGACDDGDACTVDDTCGAGRCVGGPAPADTADWLSEIGSYPSELWSFELMGEQLVLAGSTTTPWALALDAQTGAQKWKVAFEKSGSGPAFGERLTVIAQDSTGWTLGGRLGAGQFRTAENATLPVDTSDEQRHAVVRVSLDGTLSNARHVVLQPELMSPNGALFGSDHFRGSLTIPTTTGTRSLAASGFFDAVVGRESPDALELTWAWHITGPGTEAVMQIAVANGGDLLVPIYATRAVVMTDGVTTTTALGCDCPQVLLARFSLSGDLLGTKQLVAGFDEVFTSSRSSRLLVDGSELVLAGTVYGSFANFGDPASSIEYFTTQFFSSGGAETGAGGDGFVARYDAAGAIGRADFLRPIEFGAQWTSSSLRDGLVWVVGGASPRAFIGSDQAERVVGGIILAAYRQDGALAAVAESTGGEPGYYAYRGPLVMTGPQGALYIAGASSTASEVGFGNARKVVTGTYVERFNSRGGFYCRASQ